MPTPINEFTIQSFLLTVLIASLFVIGFIALHKWGLKKEKKRLDKQSKEVTRIEVNRLLALDEFEQKIS